MSQPLSGERRELVTLIRACVAELGEAQPQRSLREAFVNDSYSRDMRDWKHRRDLYHGLFVAVTLGIAARSAEFCAGSELHRHALPGHQYHTYNHWDCDRGAHDDQYLPKPKARRVSV